MLPFGNSPSSPVCRTVARNNTQARTILQLADSLGRQEELRKIYPSNPAVSGILDDVVRMGA